MRSIEGLWEAVGRDGKASALLTVQLVLVGLHACLYGKTDGTSCNRSHIFPMYHI